MACFLWQLLGWAAGAIEIWLALRFLGRPATLAEALVIEAVVQAVSSVAFLVPGALGVQEGGFVLVCGLFGIGVDTALALSVLKRLRELSVAAAAMVSWQMVQLRETSRVD